MLLLTEGKHDVSILEVAWMKIRPGQDCPCLITAADPSGINIEGGARMLADAIGAVLPAYNRKAIALFDRDPEGIRAFDSLSSNFKQWNNNSDIKVHVNNIAFAILLPVPSGREEYAARENLIMEFMFPDSALETRTTDNRGLDFEIPTPTIVLNNRKVDVQQGQLVLPIALLASCRKILAGKDVFANEIVPNLPANDFQAFEGLFQIMEQLISA